jgi:hypothetical protein
MRLENLMLGAWRSQTHAIATRRPRGGRGFWGRTRVCSSKRGGRPCDMNTPLPLIPTLVIVDALYPQTVPSKTLMSTDALSPEVLPFIFQLIPNKTRR